MAGEKWVGRRKFITTVAGGLGFLALRDVGVGEGSLPQKRLPNILFIAADDLGYAELGGSRLQGYSNPKH